MAKFLWAGSRLPVSHCSPNLEKARREVGLSIDNRPTHVAPRLLELQSCFGAKANLFPSGARLVKQLALVVEIIEYSQDVYAHGVRHIPVDQYGPQRVLADLETSGGHSGSLCPTVRPYLVRLPYAGGHGG